MDFSDVIYVPQLKWKAGERTAMQRLRRGLTSRVLPLFRLTPPGGYEADLRVSLSKDAFLKRFGQHLADVCGRRPALVDAELLESCLSWEFGRHPFGLLLERARLAGALPIPVVRSSSSAEYRLAATSFLAWAEFGAVCVRVSLDELESTPTREEFRKLAGLANAKCEDCVLLIDAGPLAIEDEEALALLLADHFSRLLRPGDWSAIILSCTTFPKKPDIGPWQSGSFERKDWFLFRKIIELRDEFPVLPIFSDYGLEYPGNYSSGKFQPLAHLRYSTENRYFIFKGRSVKYEDKYANIFRVADQLVCSGIFKGPEFSAGDAYMSALATQRKRTGSASTWRWCATDHHVELTLRQVSNVLNVDLGSDELHVEPDQLQLILS